MMRSLILALLILIGLSKPVHAELGVVYFRDLVKSDNIVCARVERIHHDKGHWATLSNGKKEFDYMDLVAQAVVLKVIKGAKFFVGQQIYIAAYRTWTCDATRVAAGEQALFFLNNTDQRSSGELDYGMYNDNGEIDKILQGKPLYFISYSGQGKLPISRQAWQIGLVVRRDKDGVHFPGAIPDYPSGMPIVWEAQVRKEDDGSFYRRGAIPIEYIEKFLNRLMGVQSSPKIPQGKKRSPGFAELKRPVVLKA